MNDFISQEEEIDAVCGDCSEKMKKLCAGEGVCGKRLRLERLPAADALAESVKQAIGTRGSEEWILDLIEEAETIVEAREATENG